MYGVRGANGVVLIKTKKGGEENPIDKDESTTPYALWAFGSKAKAMKKVKDDKRLLDLLQARID
jgi:hypothetical protein